MSISNIKMLRPKLDKHTPRNALLLGAITAVVVLAAPSLVSAQACCTATGAGEFAVVGRCQEAAIATQLTYQRGVGTFTGRGAFHSLSNTEVDDVILSIGGGIRVLHRSLQVYGSAPLRMQRRSFNATGSDLSVRPGDVAGGVRWTALEDRMGGLKLDEPASFLPFLDLYATAKAPTGRAPEDTETTTGADITGDGAWQLSAGAKVSKFLTPKNLLGVQATYTHDFARSIQKPDGASTDYAPGDGLDLTLSYLRISNIFWSWGLNANFKAAGETYADGAAVAHSDTQRLRFGAHITHGFDFPFWEATLSGTADAWWNGASTNIPFVGPAVSVSMRRQFL
jgi:hypothetical protein